MPGDELELTPELITLAMRRSPAAWFECFGKIQVKGGSFLEPPHLICNYLQRKISEVYEYCLEHGMPCRMIILKPRQKGCSTFSTAVLYHFLSNFIKRGIIIGGDHLQSQNLYNNMFKLYANNDQFLAGSGNTSDIKAESGTFLNGSNIAPRTAGSKEAGRSFTIEAILATEVARWALEGETSSETVMSGLLKGMPNIPGTLAILESTANGRAGYFFKTWETAIEFEDMVQNGREGWIRIFAPWFAFDDSRRDPKKEGISSYEDLSREELDLLREHSLTLDQVAWMRWAIREECGGDFDKFQEDYPFDPETAFLKSGRGRFNSRALKQMKFDAISRPPQFGYLEQQSKGTYQLATDYLNNTGAVMWKPTHSNEARVLRWEMPREGLRYVLAVDMMTGGSQVVGDDPDNHGVCVLRDGYLENGVWHKRRLVAQLINDWGLWHRDKKYDLKWDVDLLAKEVLALSRYYGNCLIVPESNMDRGIIELLKLAGANLYVEEILNRTEQTRSKRYGFRTDKFTREMAVDALAAGIREYGNPDSKEGLEIWSPMALDELENFVVKQSGRSEASAGKHDDCVLSLALGIMTISQGTIYRTPQLHRISGDLFGEPGSSRRVRKDRQYT